jgi:glycyl-tRNA synthetase beta chain
VTNLVREGPPLHGDIGRYKARASGESIDVAHALEHQYWLREESAQETRRRAAKIPGGLTSLGLALIENYDTVSSYFGIGIEPSGHADPFGLRRCAQAILEIARLLDSKHPLSLNTLFKARAQFPPFKDSKSSEELCQRISTYLRERFYSLSSPMFHPSHELISAVLAGPHDDLVDIFERLNSLFQLERIQDARLLKAAKVIERTRNILKGAPPRQRTVDSSRLQEPLERKLWDLYNREGNEVVDLAEKKSYVEATDLFGALFFDPLHAFFDRVLVNVPEEPLRENRLALMQAINTLYTERIADLSKLTVVQQREES